MTKTHEHKHDHKPKKAEHVSVNKSTIWMLLTLVFAVLFIISLLTGGFGGKGASGFTDEEVTSKIVSTINQLQDGLNPSVDSITRLDDGMYEVVVTVQDQKLTSYMSPNGEFFFPQAIPMTTTPGEVNTAPPPQSNIPKSDRPEVELFIWGYCPYGVQAQGPLADVAELLGNTANFKIVPYHDGHGPYETQQNKIQSCIQKLDSDNYWAYAARFVSDIYPKCGQSRDVECDKTESVKLMDSLGIDSEAVLDCVESEGSALNAAAIQKAQENSVTGSPTLMVNGVKVQVARTADAFKTAICSAYNNAPAECGDELDSTAAAAAGSC